MATSVLSIQSSARREGSVTRDLSDAVIAQLGADTQITRDLADPLPLLDANWLGANFTPPADRTDAQKADLSLSDSLIEELMAVDTLVIGLPVYNFAPPAALKAWIDQICRVGITFNYTETGPKGLLTGKRAIIVLASGGTPAGSEIDFASRYLRHIMGFIGITDVTLIAADALGNDGGAKLDTAKAAIAAIH